MQNAAQIDSPEKLETDGRYEPLIGNAKIMLVDDEPLNTEVLQTYLSGEGYSNFVTVSESQEALEIMRRELPDVVLLDLMMPVVSGFDILTAMREDHRLKTIPAIILTSSDDADTKLSALKLGAMDFLAKPVDASELALRLRNTIAAKAYQHHLINFDQLTGLAKQELFVDNIHAALPHIQYAEGSAAVMIVRIENMSQINNSLGRDHGNELILAFSRKLQSCSQPAEVLGNDSNGNVQCHVSRISGDKFALMIGPLATAQQAARLARRVIIETGKPIKIDGQAMFTTTRIGISFFPDDATQVETLISHAETALQHARRGSGEGYMFYADEMNAESSRILAMENGLRTAIEKNELLVTFQPKVNVANGQIIGAEALIRWISEDLGFIPPDEFIPVAERTGMIVPIGAWILEQACHAAAHWRQQFGFEFLLAVNVSIRQLIDSDMEATVKSVLKQTGLPAECLTLELTENMVMENAEANIERLHGLKNIGLKISIDDFGTGYSSLSYLQRFPLDELKVDRSFINELEDETSEAPIVRAMVSLAHDLGMRVVAEGIETQVQLDYIKDLDCELYQGYLCSKPVVIKAFTDLLSAQQG